MAVRNTQKAEIVASEIRKEYANVKIDIRSLDLSSLDSISSFAKGVLEDYKKLDILINNAGIMMCPYSKTKNGFEIYQYRFCLQLQSIPSNLEFESLSDNKKDH